MNKRWYDHDPTISMAVSLLLNASKSDQLQTVKYTINLLERDEVLKHYRKEIGDPLRVSYMFPLNRRRNMEQSTRRLLEILKRLPPNIQVETAVSMINYIYLLDAGMALSDHLGDALPGDGLDEESNPHIRPGIQHIPNSEAI
ncbi:MAG: hypothetical protein K2X66_07705 [Cyanobacteria bacterium]|nr:hypothetical protein [Cyanobacteriota bacterium]